MKHGKILGLIVVSAMVAICLVACGGGGGTSAKAKGPVYLVSKTEYYSTLDGKPTTSEVTEYDEHGNMLKNTVETKDYKTNKTDSIVNTYNDYDENGYYKSFTNGKGETINVEYKIEDGHAVEFTNKAAGFKAEYEYYPDGKMKQQKSLYDDGKRYILEYNEKGLLKRATTEGDDAPGTSEYEWTYDDKGHLKSCTTTRKGSAKTTTTENTYETDENGNVIIMYENGKLARKREYVKIDNPSNYAWIRSFSSAA